MYRRSHGRIEVLLVHPGGPFWAKRDLGAWTIPKGEILPSEEPLAAARREFEEETGIAASGPVHPLGQVRLKSGKIVHAWAFEGDCDPAAIRSTTFKMEWPPRSGLEREFPEVDRGAWFPLDTAAERLTPGQAPLLDALGRLLR
jgi:predicted NUDIX family NTP pyrophosphohydrolase